MRLRSPLAGQADAQRWRRAQRASRRWGLWGLGLGAALAAVMQAPAQWLADAINRASGQHLLLAEAQGSIWNGSAMLVLTGGPGSHDASLLPGRLHWQARPDWQGLRLIATQDCCLQAPLQAHLQPAWSGFTLRVGPQGAPTPAAPPALWGQWPAAWLAGLGTPWNTLQLGGQLQWSGQDLAVQVRGDQVQMQGQLMLTLQGASSRLSALPQLGSYRLTVSGPGPAGTPAMPGSSLRLDTLDGALQLSGTGQWQGARLRFRGQAQAAPGQEAALSNLLNIIGRRQGELSVISIG